MSGIIVPIVPKQVFDFSSLAMGTSRILTIHRKLNIVPFYYASLYVRLHTLNIPSGNGSIKIEAYETDPSNSDYQEFTIATAALTVSATTSSTVPSILLSAGVVPTTSNVGPYFKIVVVGTQNSTGVVSCYAELSADLLLREA